MNVTHATHQQFPKSQLKMIIKHKEYQQFPKFKIENVTNPDEKRLNDNTSIENNDKMTLEHKLKLIQERPLTKTIKAILENQFTMTKGL